MIISVVVRTHNEERNLEKFVKAYHDWVDYIFIQDDESDDRTYLLDIMRDYPKAYVHWYYGERIIRKTITRAYQHIQLNRLIERAEGMKSDWIIMDDCDSIPNKNLRLAGRDIIEACDKNFIYIPKVTFYKDQGWFPKFAIPKDHWSTCLWAWKADKGFRFEDVGERSQYFTPIDDEKIQRLAPPFSALHCPWPNDDVIMEKRIRYTEIYGQAYSKFDPLMFAGPLDPNIPEWAVE